MKVSARSRPASRSAQASPSRATGTAPSAGAQLSIEWETDPEAVPELADFFIGNVNQRYISHGEMQTGRATDTRTWSPQFREILLRELGRAVRSRRLRGTRLAAARLDGKLAGLAVLNYQLSAATPYAILDDLVVRRARRRSGVGKKLLAWIEVQARRAGAQQLFLESGIKNEVAHGFFHRHGFHVVAVTMNKKLSR